MKGGGCCMEIAGIESNSMLQFQSLPIVKVIS